MKKQKDCNCYDCSNICKGFPSFGFEMAVAAVDLGTQYCTLCEEDGINSLATIWCTDCDTFLCSDCERYHGKSKASKEHKSIPAENFKELPAFITSTSSQCKEHRKRYQLYCSFHQVACCIECITKDHNKCIEMRQLTDILKDFKTSSTVAQTENDLKDLQENFDKITKHLKSNLGDIDAQKTKGLKQIKDMRKKINDHLNKLEQKLRDDLDNKYIKIKSGIENLLKEIENKTTQTGQLKNDFNKMKKFATELQTFVGIKEIEKMTNEKVEYLIGTKRKDLLKENDMKIKLFSDILQIESLGNVQVSSIPCNVQLTVRKEQQACLQVQNPIEIGQTKPKLLKKISIGKNVSITGCQILPTGQMLFVDGEGKRLMLFSDDGSFVQVVVIFTEKPYDVTYIKDNTVAVTTCNDRKVHFVDFDRNVILKSKNMSTYSYGIDSDGEAIRIICGHLEDFLISLDIDGTSELSSRIIPSFSSNIATFGENIYITEYNGHTVKCLSKNGDVLWTYQLTEGKQPRGLSVDKQGFVYVACRENNKIVVVSPEGKESRTILTNNDGILCPLALNIDRNKSKLLVVNVGNGDAFLYQV